MKHNKVEIGQLRQWVSALNEQPFLIIGQNTDMGRIDCFDCFQNDTVFVVRDYIIENNSKLIK